MSDLFGSLGRELARGAPVWAKVIVLLIVALAGLDIMGLLAIASYRGIQVDFWPPKIGQYEPPEVANCKILIAGLTVSAEQLDTRIAKLEEIYSHQSTAVIEFLRKSSEAQGDHIDKANAFASSGKVIQAEEAQTRALIDGAVSKYREELVSTRDKCLQHRV